MCGRAEHDLAGDLDLVLFDLDGTLYPDNAAINAPYPEVALRMASVAAGIGDPEAARDHFAAHRARVEERIGGRATNTLVLLSCYDIPFEAFEAEIARVSRIEEALAPDPEAASVVAQVACAHPVALYTTNNETCAARILARIGMADLFPPHRRLTLSDLGRLPLPRAEILAHVKPGLAGFRLALERFGGVAPERAMMVGDSEVSDLAPARALGMRTHRVACREDLLDLPARLGL